ncbi:hypothetical protein B9G69_007170 [Bdellovibrio sp. SKB1291214]|uniref:hypothetical protein n=1 Tax=Bdellovibrio sp. SKB1291214 TaxID=1732569 RepID=UPI0011318E3B|nr:hypothetical protein [Bdellovibrio sp. SKB1291214]UYL10359.1 hypothetical protein B9G69_007170 [Bdellovibrio sp. SKB1291214]
MKSIYLILLGLFLTSGASAHLSHSPKISTWATFLAPDFVIGTPPALKNQDFSLVAPAATEGCKERISKITCALPSLESNHPCIPASDRATENIQSLYDVLPKPMQKMFCSIPRILIVEKMESLAMAGINENGKAFVVISKSLVEDNLAPNAVFTWKEQKAFGVQIPRFESLKEGPQIWSKSRSPQQTLQYVITHEFAHLFDFLNNANRFVCAPGKTCNMHPKNMEEALEYQRNVIPEMDSWSAYSWKNGLEPNDANNFPLWSKLCFYNCNETLKLGDMFDFYLQLDRTNFVTTYAAVNPYEDFAESVTFYLMANADYDLQYRIFTGKTFFFQEWKWSNLVKKHNWIELFFEGDLKYPQ